MIHWADEIFNFFLSNYTILIVGVVLSALSKVIHLLIKFLLKLILLIVTDIFDTKINLWNEKRWNQVEFNKGVLSSDTMLENDKFDEFLIDYYENFFKLKKRDNYLWFNFFYKKFKEAQDVYFREINFQEFVVPKTRRGRMEYDITLNTYLKIYFFYRKLLIFPIRFSKSIHYNLTELWENEIANVCLKFYDSIQNIYPRNFMILSGYKIEDSYNREEKNIRMGIGNDKIIIYSHRKDEKAAFFFNKLRSKNLFDSFDYSSKKISKTATLFNSKISELFTQKFIYMYNKLRIEDYIRKRNDESYANISFARNLFLIEDSDSLKLQFDAMILESSKDLKSFIEELKKEGLEDDWRYWDFFFVDKSFVDKFKIFKKDSEEYLLNLYLRYKINNSYVSIFERVDQILIPIDFILKAIVLITTFYVEKNYGNSISVFISSLF